jgi:hypothetical protein
MRQKQKPKRRVNPPADIAAAGRVFESFHGSPVKWVENVESHYVFRPTHAKLGELLEIWLAVPGEETKGQPIFFSAPRPILAATPDARTLYILGGDQRIDWRALGVDEAAVKDETTLGEVARIVYHTRKAFDGLKPQGYGHDFGSIADGNGPLLAPWQKRLVDRRGKGPRPWLVYDALNEAFKLVGGAYSVRPEGIVF